MNNITFRDALEWASRKVHLSRGDLQSESNDTRALLILKLYKLRRKQSVRPAPVHKVCSRSLRIYSLGKYFVPKSLLPF